MWCDLGKSVWSRMWHFEFPISLKCSLGEVHLLLITPPESVQWFQSYSNWRMHKTIENKKNNSFFCLYFLINAPNFRLIPLDRNNMFLYRIVRDDTFLEISGFLDIVPSSSCIKTWICRDASRQVSNQNSGFLRQVQVFPVPVIKILSFAFIFSLL